MSGSGYRRRDLSGKGTQMPFRVIAALVFSGLLAACGGPGKPLPRDVPPIGDFRLGYNIVVANDVTRAPGSRECAVSL